MTRYPHLITPDGKLEKVYRTAIGDLVGNIYSYKSENGTYYESCLLAGIHYKDPWTRDAAINTWFALSLLFPQVAKNTLLSVVSNQPDQPCISGQYWDKILWAIGYERYLNENVDPDFAEFGYKTICTTLRQMEKMEFSEEYGLFRGPACIGDGVSAYPDFLSNCGGSSEILLWPKNNPELAHPVGYGIPIHCLSTNLAYLNAYRVVSEVAQRNCLSHDYLEFSVHKAHLEQSIRKHFMTEVGGLRYIASHLGNDDSQEALGYSFALLFNLLNEDERNKLVQSSYHSKLGTPCLYPPFERYSTLEHCGRHSGSLWPPIQAFWALSTLNLGANEIFDTEFLNISNNIFRDGQCEEIFHPKTGKPYGGLQEWNSEMIEWASCKRQSWSASAFLGMLFYGIIGINIKNHALSLRPHLPANCDRLMIDDLTIGQSNFKIHLKGIGDNIDQCLLDGIPFSPSNIDIREPKSYFIEITLSA